MEKFSVTVNPENNSPYQLNFHLNRFLTKRKPNRIKSQSMAIPDQNGPHTPGMNNLECDTVIWQVEVPHTNTMRRLIASSSTSTKQ